MLIIYIYIYFINLYCTISVCLYWLYLNFYKIFSSAIEVATFQILSSHKWLVAMELENLDAKCFHHQS